MGVYNVCPKGTIVMTPRDQCHTLIDQFDGNYTKGALSHPRDNFPGVDQDLNYKISAATSPI